MNTVHNFKDSLALSHQYADAPWWEPVYRKAFPAFAGMNCVRYDGPGQRSGIDRVILLSSGKTISVDEKVRSEDWPDFILELWSDRDKRKKGWIQKELLCDYIAYAFIPSKTCFLLPFQQLRLAWRNNHCEWYRKAIKRIEGFRIVDADNGWYITQSVAVPQSVLMSAIQRAMIVGWE